MWGEQKARLHENSNLPEAVSAPTVAKRDERMMLLTLIEKVYDTDREPYIFTRAMNHRNYVQNKTFDVNEYAAYQREGIRILSVE